MKKLCLSAMIAAALFSSCAPKTVNLPVTRTFDCDVLVIGGGAAGISTAISSARHGAKTILAERNGVLGGTATAGLVAPFMSSTTPDGNTLLIRGVFEEFVNNMIAENGAIHPLDAQIGSWTAYRDRGHHGLTTFDYECFKRTADKMCKDSGVELLYHLLFVKAEVKKGHIKAAYFATKDGIWKITAKTYVDCTGDGDVAFQAGAPYVYGDGEGDIQASSLFFTVRGVDKAAMDAHNEACKKADDFEGQFYMREILAAREAGEFPMWRQKIALFENLDGTYTVNMCIAVSFPSFNPFDERFQFAILIPVAFQIVIIDKQFQLISISFVMLACQTYCLTDIFNVSQIVLPEKISCIALRCAMLQGKYAFTVRITSGESLVDNIPCFDFAVSCCHDALYPFVHSVD